MMKLDSRVEIPTVSSKDSDSIDSQHPTSSSSRESTQLHPTAPPAYSSITQNASRIHEPQPSNGTELSKLSTHEYTIRSALISPKQDMRTSSSYDCVVCKNSGDEPKSAEINHSLIKTDLSRNNSFQLTDFEKETHVYSSPNKNRHVVTTWGQNRRLFPMEIIKDAQGDRKQLIKRDDPRHQDIKHHPTYSGDPDTDKHVHVAFNSKEELKQALQRYLPNVAKNLGEYFSDSSVDN